MTARTGIVAIVTLAALLRFAINDVSAFSPADESIYVDLTERLTTHGFLAGYDDLVKMWVSNSAWWRYPSPMRFGYLALTTVAANLYGGADPRALAWLSTLAGLLVVPVVFAVAKRLADTRTALLAAAFTAVSPLELALGRRALQDEVFCLAVVVAFFALLRAIDRPSFLTTATAIAALTFAIAVKETFLLLYPALAIFLVAQQRPSARHVATLAVPPLLWWVTLAALARDVTAPFQMAKAVASAMAARYVVQYQSGPPHRVLFDFVILAPFVSVLACAAVVALLLDSKRDVRMRATALFVITGLAVFALLVSKNLRFLIVLDPFLRVLAAWIVATGARVPTLVAVGGANAVIELELFRSMFLVGSVYDPVTHTMLESLGAVPRDSLSPPAPMLWPWICAAIAGVLWLARRTAAVTAKDATPPRPARLATDGAAGARR